MKKSEQTPVDTPKNNFESCELVKKLMDQLSDDERFEIMDNYCRHCGSKDPSCQCWNDD